MGQTATETGADADYVIIGGGTAGCVLADRLTEAGHSVLLLEAGGRRTSPWSHIPAGWTRLLNSGTHNWRFSSAPEARTGNRPIVFPRGKGLGGSSLLNGMIWVRGQRQDYDDWKRDGCDGWGFDDLLPYFRKTESWAGEPDQIRGQSGPIPVEEVAYRAPLSDTFLKAARECGHPLAADYNGADQEGACQYQTNQRRGRRYSAAQGYLGRALRRENLRLLDKAHVTAIRLQGGRASAVEYVRHGKTGLARARREILLCAGGIQSPQILELSGIGDPGHLAKAGIAVWHELPAVGNHFTDHYCVRMHWRVRNAQTLNETTRGWRLMREVARYATTRSGVLTLGTGLAGGFFRTDPGLDRPDIQLFFIHASYGDAATRKLDSRPGMTIGVSQLRPLSRGDVHVASPDPFRAPVIRPNFLAEPADADCMAAGMRLARNIAEAPAFGAFIESELKPGTDCQNAEDFRDFVHTTGQSIYHAAGTCRMGTDPATSVVDLRLRAHGIGGLRVVDASVMPSMVSGNIQAAVYAIAEKAADLIMRDARA